MKSIYYILIAMFILLALVIIFWSNIREYFFSNNNSNTGSECQTESGVSGTLVDGICVPPRSIPSPPTPDLQVSNPNGAYMYYQSRARFGGVIYSQSNVLIPYGEKLTLVKFWQSNTSNQPGAGYYETTNKQYGPSSGFFDTSDIVKIN